MDTALIWFRQDLRLSDNPAFLTACQRHQRVIPLYIYQNHSVLGEAQKWWLHHSLQKLAHSLKKRGLFLILRQGNPLDVIHSIHQQHPLSSVYWNRCYEPSSILRDTEIKADLAAHGLQVISFNSHLLNEPWTIFNKEGDYFKVFTPFWKQCLTKIHPFPSYPTSKSEPRGISLATDALDDWQLLPQKPNWAYRFPHYWQPGEEGAKRRLQDFIEQKLKNYKTQRDIPASNGSSRLSPHLHFGEISPYALWQAIEIAHLSGDCDTASTEHFLSELGWREFSYYLLYHQPSLPHANFKPAFDTFPWQHDPCLLKRWQQGQTGYPIVDAGMRELWATGYMHNRVRMIVASFLVKDLLLDWRLGAEWFLNTLLDADLANNSASWQWVAGSGADAAPYFRIFNPVRQSQLFDPDGSYIRQWVPELASLAKPFIHEPWLNKASLLINYPPPIVEHHEARKKALEKYNSIKNTSWSSKK